MKMLDPRMLSMEVALKLRKLKVRNPERLALIIQFFHHHISTHKRKKRNFKQGRTWNHCTWDEIQENLYCLDIHQIEYCMIQLVNLKILIKGNFNKCKYDRTCWYAFYNEQDWSFSPDDIEEDSYEQNVHNSVDKEESDPDQSGSEPGPVGQRTHTSRGPIPQYTHRNTNIHNTEMDRDVKISKEIDSEKIEKGKIGDVKNPMKCFKLNNDQMRIYWSLKEEFPETLDGTIASWVKTYGPETLKKAHKITQKSAKTNKGAFMAKVLASEKKRNSDSYRKNLQYAKYVIEEMNLKNIEIREDCLFLRKENGSYEEILLMLDEKMFADKLMSFLYE